ncbi:efflux RND transporter permease subunit [Paraliomyxa miuraensis]|uniref:efflux RND transporter permease subunit n=1 Tax=Paraliomyxa miuraensis TaxID=376150 RepID=UPI00225A7362|nr:efflux RND transporter permease subunit [Paraliomyxa miuraensis]MCX4240933.1 efflux RND transporter permease subunit [Paraliomyxa miuraensis]
MATSTEPLEPADAKGVVSWFARNHVAANLLMLALLLGGIVVGLGVKQEVFPDFKLDMVAITVPYPGASPSEVEQGIIVAIEEAVRDLDGVDRVTSSAQEGAARIYVSLELDAEPNTLLADVKNAVDRLTSLPEDSERPLVSLVTNRLEVISLILYGDQDDALLRSLAEWTRDQLLEDPEITQCDLLGAPAHETSVEVPLAKLREHGLTLEGIAQVISASALELPGGAIKTDGGEVLLRTAERRQRGLEYAELPVLTSPTGTQVTLGDIAIVRESFAETDESATYDGKPAIMLKVFRTGDQTPIEVADAVKARLEVLRTRLPEGVSVTPWVDWSQIYRERIDLLMRNAQLGLLLVLLVLGLFLEIRLAFWVTMGIPTSFLGALLLMPAMDVSVNMLSLFAFIVTLGMVVDDAIVVGENIHEARQRGEPPMRAAVRGARQVAIPVCFSIATTVVAFMPMLFVPGFSGKFYRVIPSIVISVLVISLVESLWVLPAHLAALKDPPERGLHGALHRQQQRVSRALERFVRRWYAPVLHGALRRRYLSLAVGLFMLLCTAGWIAGGRIGFRFMPEIDGSLALATIELPYGAAPEDTDRIRRHVLAAARRVLDDNGEEGILQGVFSQLGTPLPGDPGTANRAVVGGHLANVQVFLVPSGERELSSATFLQRWRREVGRVAGIENMRFSIALGPSPGAPINVELQHESMEVLEQASTELAEVLTTYPGVWDINDGFARGKPQLDLKMTNKASVLGLTAADVARQVRAAFYGAEALRQQVGRNEVRVVVRLPSDERRHVHDFENLLLRTPTGGEVPLREVAQIVPGRSWPVINRAEGVRFVEVTADVRTGEANPGTILDALAARELPALIERHPGLTYEFGGSQREQAKAMGSLGNGAWLAMIGIFALLAIPFRSYSQPIIVMAAIPFGLVGAILGHVIMGFTLSMISVMGIVALSGVVVNDSLVLVDAANGYRAEGRSLYEAIAAAGVRRFRPILLTSLTTFLGLIPMITETSAQAQFLIPMAVSLGFGVLFATFIVLLLVPAYYLVLHDVLAVFGRSEAVVLPPGDGHTSAGETLAQPAE